MSVSSQQQSVEEAVRELLIEAKDAAEERSKEKREPFLAPATVIVEESGERRSNSCFCRDISPIGIGLLHNMKLKTGEAVVKVALKSGTVTCFRSALQWCRPFAKGWFISGARFLDLSPEASSGR